MAILGDGKLIDRQPVVAVGIVKVNDACLRAGDGSIGAAIFHRDALGEHAMESAVAGFECCTGRISYAAEGILESVGGQVGVEARKGIPQTLCEYNFAVVGALGEQCFRRDVWPVRDAPVQAFEPGEGGVFDDGFGQTYHGSSTRWDEAFFALPSGFSRSNSHCNGLLTTYSRMRFRDSSSRMMCS